MSLKLNPITLANLKKAYLEYVNGVRQMPPRQVLDIMLWLILGMFAPHWISILSFAALGIGWCVVRRGPVVQ